MAESECLKIFDSEVQVLIELSYPLFRLVSFNLVKPAANQQPPPRPSSTVSVSKVVTEKELIERSMKLETSIQSQVRWFRPFS